MSSFMLQMLPAVTPEQYPLEPPPGSAAAEHDGRLAFMHAQQQREQQHHTDKCVSQTCAVVLLLSLLQRGCTSAVTGAWFRP
jgi:hypothetical protein